MTRQMMGNGWQNRQNASDVEREIKKSTKKLPYDIKQLLKGNFFIISFENCV